MCDALRELMKDDIEREVSAARKLGESEGEVRGKAMGEVVGEAKIILKNEPQRNVHGKHCIHHRQGSG